MLVSGSRLGPYELLSPLGAGGMGEVYRAKDLKLGREVAIKILPEVFASDPDRLARFQREAQVLASLNHPNIAAIYGLEESDGTKALVLELVPGETLADRIARGRIPLDEAIPIAKQIAEALEAAHEQGIIHRDLKPANIKVTPDGVVKVLDFGLAKLAQPSGASMSPLSMSPTITSPAMMTGVGVLLGTAPYMSPEQAKWREADKRSDVWAFGCVLYEMLTGKRAFDGEDVAETLASVLKGTPDLTSVPVNIRRLLTWCWRKDAKNRLQSITDARLLLDEAVSPAEEPSHQFAPVVPWVLAAASLIAALIVSLLHFRDPLPRSAEPYRLQLQPPEDGVFVQPSASGGGLSLSPNGRTVAYVANVTGRTALWIQPLDGSPRMLPGTANATAPFWSPDGSSLAFFAGGKLWRTTARGETPFPVCDVQSPRGGAWVSDDEIVFGTYPGTGIYKVRASGGSPTPLTMPSGPSKDVNHFWPQVLPGNRLLYWVGAFRGSVEQRGAYVAPLSRPSDTRRIVVSDSNALFARGGDDKSYLLWIRGDTLLAQEIDPTSLDLLGMPHALASRVATSGNTAFMHLAVSSNGVLVYRPISLTRFTWFDRTGRPGAVVGEAADYGTFNLSHNDLYVAASRVTAGGTELWRLELERGVSTPLATGDGAHAYPVWSANDTTIIFEGANTGLARKRIAGAEPERNVLDDISLQIPLDWSSDGSKLLYLQDQRLWVLRVTPEGRPTPDERPVAYLDSQATRNAARWSPTSDPQWVVFHSRQTGQPEVYVERYPEPQGLIPVSTGGGRWPEWSPDGREIFYVSADNTLMAAAFDPRNGTVMTPRALFSLPASDNGFSPYDVSSDGQRFLVRTPTEQGARSLTVLINWPQLLKQGTQP